MSTETEQAKAKDSAKAKSSHGGDHDLDHSASVAHKTSKAGLKQADAAAQQSADFHTATDEQRLQQSEKANNSTITALDDAATYAAKQMLVLAKHIDEVSSAPEDMAGWTRRIDEVNKQVKAAEGNAKRLDDEVKLAQKGGVGLAPLRQTLSVFSRAHSRFENAVLLAARRSKEPFHPNVGTLNELAVAIFAKLGMTQNQLAVGFDNTKSIATLEKTDTRKVLQVALESNTVALMDSARNARMNLAAPSPKDHEQEVGHAIAHVRELDKLVTDADPALRHQEKKRTLLAVAEMERLGREGGEHSLIGALFKAEHVPKLLDNIRNLVSQ